MLKTFELRTSANSVPSADSSPDQDFVALHAAPPVPRIELPFTRPVYLVVPTVNVISSPRSLPSVIGLPPSVPVTF